MKEVIVVVERCDVDIDVLDDVYGREYKHIRGIESEFPDTSEVLVYESALQLIRDWDGGFSSLDDNYYWTMCYLEDSTRTQEKLGVASVIIEKPIEK